MLEKGKLLSFLVLLVVFAVVISVTTTVHASRTIKVTVNHHSYQAELADNTSARAFRHRLEKEPVVVNAHGYGEMEKVGRLPWSLPQSNRQIRTKPGQIILYQGRELSLYYRPSSWSLTPIAQIQHVNTRQLKKDLGSGKVQIKYALRK